MEHRGTAWPPELANIWAKSGDETGWLSLRQHMMDSADVAGYLWDEWLSESAKNLLASQWSLEPREAAQLVRFLAGSHDIGKAEPLFIGQLADRQDTAYLVDTARLAGLSFPASLLQPRRIPHSHLSEVIIARYLMQRTGMSKLTANTWAAIAGSHHGLPMAKAEQSTALRYLDQLGAEAPEWRLVHDPALESLANYTGIAPLLPQLQDLDLSSPGQMLVTGLVIMADWIASNVEACPLSPEGFSNDPQRAELAMQYVGLPPPWQATPPADSQQAYRHRFHWPESRSPRPVQREALDLLAAADDADNALLIVEAPMGAGKTELALLCAEHLARRFDCGGIMVAAPTMATANGLFTRVAEWARQSMHDAPASLFLAHSKAQLNTDFQRFAPQGIGEPEAADSLHAHQWLTGRKKGILANAVVGTIDQVLFMALQSKHMMLRHLGLAQKVVVIDEVHAVDAYMASYLKCALMWLGRYNTPVILLSATLPGALKDELTTAYTTGRIAGPARAAAAQPDDHYPVLTLASSSGTQIRHPHLDAGSVPVSMTAMLDDVDSLREALRATAEHGGCTAIICSTVARAQEAYALAKELVGQDAQLLHSRFTANQRVAQERDLLQALGPNASRENKQRPQRAIIVATQVIEQSLDIDVDFMITDIAPSDLVLQRSGRLHRHQREAADRPAWASLPRVLVRGFTELPTEQGVAFDDLVALIYPEALLMSSTVALGLLQPENTVSIPEQIPEIVRITYSFDCIPENWHEQFAPAQQRLQADRKQAALRSRTFLLGRPASDTLSDLFGSNFGDIGNDPAAEQKGLAQVRDAEASMEAILIQQSGDGYRILPWLAGPDTAATITDDFAPSFAQQQVLAASTVQLPRAVAFPSELEDNLDELLRQTPPGWQQAFQLRDQLALRLDEEMRGRIGNRELAYSREFGLLDLSQKSQRRLANTLGKD